MRNTISLSDYYTEIWPELVLGFHIHCLDAKCWENSSETSTKRVRLEKKDSLMIGYSEEKRIGHSNDTLLENLVLILLLEFDIGRIINRKVRFSISIIVQRRD
mgnify:CR=1 FL=1